MVRRMYLGVAVIIGVVWLIWWADEANKPIALHRMREYYIRKHLPEYAEHRLKREIERLDDWEEIRKGLVTPKRKR